MLIFYVWQLTISLEEAVAVPTSILSLPGIPELILGRTVSQRDGTSSSSAPLELATSIMESASVFQKKASTTRLAQALIAYRSPGLAGFQHTNCNLDSAAKVKVARKAKNEESKLLNNGIHVTASLWESHKNKLSQVSPHVYLRLKIAEVMLFLTIDEGISDY